jgi:hypothetical protein
LGISVGGFSPNFALAQDDPTTNIDDEMDDDMPPVDDDVTIENETEMETQMGVTTSTSATTELSEPYGDEDVNIRTEIRTETPPAQPMPATEEPDINVYIEDDDDRPRYGGIGISAGGGVNEFGNENLRDITDTGGAWTARLILGTRSPIALEAAYIGTANRIATLGLDDATLVSNGAEGALRLHFLQIPLTEDGSALFQPYLLAGFAWKHYNLTGADFNTSSVQEDDDVFEVPLGGGLAVNVDQFLADARFDYRPALSDDLVRPINDDNNDNSLQTWTISGRVGVEF